VRPDIAKLDELIDRSQHMVDGHVLLERELVKQSTLIDLPLAHHHLHSALITGVNHYNDPAATSEFFNRIDPLPTFGNRGDAANAGSQRGEYETAADFC
jgi:hypothetical protein